MLRSAAKNFARVAVATDPAQYAGIVEELGTVVSRDGPKLRLAARTVLDDVTMGASIAVNGCCLTVVAWDDADGWWEADVTEESYARTALGDLELGDPVNLERPVRLSDRLGGHLVQGRGEAIEQLVRDAHAVEDAGAFAVVLEMVTSEASVGMEMPGTTV